MLEWPAPASATLSAGLISEDGLIIAAGYSNGEVAVRSLMDGKTLAHLTINAHLSGDTLKEVEQSGLLSEENRAKVRQGAKTLEVGLGPMTMSVSPDAQWLALAMVDRSIKLINLVSGEVRDTLGNHRGRGQDLAFSPNSALLAVVEAGEYRALNVYQVATGERLINLSLNSQASPQLRPLSDGKGFATIDKGGRIFVHPVFQDWQDLVSYLAREFPERLTPNQRRAFFID
jgi:WD40 repeat protein